MATPCAKEFVVRSELADFLVFTNVAHFSHLLVPGVSHSAVMYNLYKFKAAAPTLGLEPVVSRHVSHIVKIPRIIWSSLELISLLLNVFTAAPGALSPMALSCWA